MALKPTGTLADSHRDDLMAIALFFDTERKLICSLFRSRYRRNLFVAFLGQGNFWIILLSDSTDAEFVLHRPFLPFVSTRHVSCSLYSMGALRSHDFLASPAGPVLSFLATIVLIFSV